VLAAASSKKKKTSELSVVSGVRDSMLDEKPSPMMLNASKCNKRRRREQIGEDGDDGSEVTEARSRMLPAFLFFLLVHHDHLLLIQILFWSRGKGPKQINRR